MRDYLKELDIEFKKIDEETEKRLAEWERKREEIEEKNRREERKREERKKKLSYRIPIFILKTLIFLLIIGFGMIAGIYYFIVALVVSLIVGSIFIKL